MFFITNPYLTLAKLGGSLPKFQGNDGSSEVDLTDSDGDGVPDNAIIEDGSAYWTDAEGNVQMANIDPQGNWEMSNDNQGGGNVDPATGLTFSQAFRQARDAGQETFMWNGKSYTTKTDEEESSNNEENNKENNIDDGIDDDTEKKDENLTDLEKAQNLVNQGQNDLGFKDPDQATILSGIGDNPFLELADAVERGVKSFGADEYYDPGSKEDYMKYTVRNVSDQDMVYNPEDRLKAMYNPGKYLKTNKEFEDEIIEEGMMDFYKQRRKEGAGGKDMYGRVTDFDADQFRETGIGATYGRQGPGMGDDMENKYQNASYLGFSNVDGNVRPADYLTRGPGFAGVEGDPNTYIRQDFEGSSTPFDRSDDSPEWERSMRNPLNQPITLMPKIGPTQIPLNTPGAEDLIPLSPNMARYGGGLTRYQNRGEVNEDGMMTGPDGQPVNIMLPTVELEERDPNFWRRNKKKISNWGHGVLDVAGLIPGLGEIFDGVNALWYAAEGDKTNAALSAAAMIPVAGWAATGGKFINKGVKAVKGAKANKSILSGGKKGIDEGMEYAVKYTSDPDYLKYMNTEKVRMARELNNAKLSFDINKPTGIDPTTGGFDLFKTQDLNLKPRNIHDKINSRVSFADITNPNKKFMIGMDEQYRNPFLFKSQGDINLGIGDFRNTYDDLLMDAQKSGFRSSSKVIDDINTSGGIFYPGAHFKGRNANRFTSKSSVGNMYNPFPDGRFYVKNADGSVGIHEYSHFLDHAGLNFSRKQTDDLFSLRRKDKPMMDWTKQDPEFLKDYKYYTEPTEIKARMFQMRQKAGLMPGDKFTTDMLKQYTQPSLFNRMRGSLFGDQSKNMFGMQGYLNLNTPKAQQNFLDVMNRYKKVGGSLPKAQQLGEFNNPTLGLTIPSLSGYSLSGNTPSPFATPGPSLSNPTGLINTPVLNAPSAEDQYKPMTDADMYASSQAVQRSMDSFDAFTADMNKRMENPSLSMNQVDTNPLNVPKVDFSPSPELQKSFDAMDYTMAEQEGRVMGSGYNATIVPSAEEMQQQSEEFSANLEEQMDNIPEYQGTQENLDRFDEANERGFDGDLAAMDEFDARQEQEQADADLARTQIDLASEKPSFADRAYNTLLRAADSKAAQTYSKISNMAIDMAKPITKIAADRNARIQKSKMMKNAYMSDNLFAATDADTSGNKGNYDPNTGLFRPDDKVVVGTTGSARFGGSFYKSGGAIDIDMNTYKQLVAAGAEITIL